jgi:hypothetical protein
MMNTGYSFYM